MVWSSTVTGFVFALLLLFVNGRAFSLPPTTAVVGPAARKQPTTHRGRQRLKEPSSITTRTKPRDPFVWLQQQSSSSSPYHNAESSNIPRWVYRLNASTKWLVTVAATLGIWTRLPHYEGPFIVVGAIASVYLTDVLKQLINHDRPNGAPFTDPGMPSSHSLVSFFQASAWMFGVLLPRQNMILSALVTVGASTVALLRVICGYHSWDQIGVGAVLGSTLGFGWAKIGNVWHDAFPVTMAYASWTFYILGSALFIGKNMKEWIAKDKHL